MRRLIGYDLIMLLFLIDVNFGRFWQFSIDAWLFGLLDDSDTVILNIFGHSFERIWNENLIALDFFERHQQWFSGVLWSVGVVHESIWKIAVLKVYLFDFRWIFWWLFVWYFGVGL